MLAMAESAARSEPLEVKGHIARAAARLFAAQGYDATSVREIVEEAGVAKPTLYYHFGSKEGLAQALFTLPMTSLIERLRHVVEGPGDPVEDLEQIFRAHFDFCQDEPDCCRFVFAVHFGPRSSSLQATLASCRGKELDGVLNFGVRRLAEAGLIPADRAEDLVLACHGLIVFHTLKYLYKDGELGPDLPGRLVFSLLHGFGSPVGATAAPGRLP
ncbi:TetR/AcrR family transcriptional regulator [Isosphaeraceae bacterium EP7]